MSEVSELRKKKNRNFLCKCSNNLWLFYHTQKIWAKMDEWICLHMSLTLILLLFFSHFFFFNLLLNSTSRRGKFNAAYKWHIEFFSTHFNFLFFLKRKSGFLFGFNFDHILTFWYDILKHLFKMPEQ